VTLNVATVMSRVFKKTSPLDQLMRSSAEARLASVKKSVLEQTGFTVEATFEQHAVCTAPDGKFHRVTFETNEGRVKVTDSAVIDGWAPSVDDLVSEAKSAINTAVDSIFRGADFDLDPIFTTLQMGEDIVKRLTTSLLGESIKASRFWKKYLAEAEQSVLEVLRGKLAELSDSYPVSKYVAGTDVSADGVTEDLKAISVKLKALKARIEALNTNSVDEDTSVAATLKKMAVEIQEDLSRYIDLIDVVTTGKVNVEQAVSTYEKLVTSVPDFFVATELVVAMADSVSNPSDRG